MRAGDTCVYQGSEVALLPFDYVSITQVSDPNSYSHCCGHPVDYAFPSYVYPIYAPFSCHLFEAIASGNRRAYVSDAPVWTAAHGLTYVTVSFTHDDNPPSATHFNQGQLIAHSGRNGQYVTGDHCHMDQAPYADMPLIYSGRICNSGNPCYYMQDDVEPEAIFYLAGSENLVNTAGKTFQTWSGSPIDPGPGPGPGPGGGGNFKIWMAAKLLRRRKNGL